MNQLSQITRPHLPWVCVSIVAIVLMLGGRGWHGSSENPEEIGPPTAQRATIPAQQSLPREAMDAYTPIDPYCVSAGYQYLVHYGPGEIPGCAIFLMDESGLASHVALFDAPAIHARVFSATARRLTPQEFRAVLLGQAHSTKRHDSKWTHDSTGESDVLEM